MIPVDDMDELNEAIKSDKGVMMFVWRKECEDCPELGRKLARLARKYPPLVAFSLLLDEHPTAAARFGVFNPPAVVVYAGHKMVMKQVERIDLQALARYLDKLYTY